MAALIVPVAIGARQRPRPRRRAATALATALAVGRAGSVLVAAALAGAVVAGPISLDDVPAPATPTPTLDALSVRGVASAAGGSVGPRSATAAAAPTPLAAERPAPRPAIEMSDDPLAGARLPAMRPAGAGATNAAAPLPAAPDRRAESRAVDVDAEGGEGRSKARELAAEALDERLAAALRDEALRLEHGTGVERDTAIAARLYCEAARLGDATAQFNLGWMHAHGRGLPRDDATAAFFFAAAAEQGIEQARRMLALVDGAPRTMPACMQAPVEAPPAVVADVPPTPWPEPPRSAAPKALIELVRRTAGEYGIEPRLVLTIIELESNFDSRALSPKNAMGLMQLVPDTAARFSVRDPYDPKQNVRGGVAYLRWLLAYFEGDLALVAAAYNAGEGTVERYRGVPPYAETRAYVRRVLQAARVGVHPYDARVTAPSARLGAIRGSGAAVARN